MQFTRREFLSGAAGTMGAPAAFASRLLEPAADVILRIARTKLDVAPDYTLTTVTYNGGDFAAPIRLKEDVPVNIQIVNDSDCREYVHWHGFLVPSALDGTQEEGSLAIAPGAKLRYLLTPSPAGTRFVHTHAMPMNDLNRGVYGGQFLPVYVESRRAPGKYDQEIFLTTHEWGAYLTTEEEEESLTESVLHQVRNESRLRRCGDAICEIGYQLASINGKALGYGEPIRVKEGQRILFRITNASATESIRLALPGHRFYVVSLDGNDVPAPRFVDVLELGVAERVDAVVHMNQPGIWVLGSTDPQARENGLGIVVEYANKTGAAVWTEAPESQWDYTIFGSTKISNKRVREIPMVITRIAPDRSGIERWAINGKSYDPRQPPEILRIGERYRLVFKNETEEAHPLHLHRARFELTNVNGKQTSGVWKDVAVVKGFETLSVDFTPEQAGPALFHCHQQMHMDSGFKKLFRIV